MRLAVIHNLHFYNNLMQEIRDNLDNGTFEDYKMNFVLNLIQEFRKVLQNV